MRLRSTVASGLVSNDVPRSASSAATELLTYTVAVPSSDRYISSSYSYCRKRPAAAAARRERGATHRANGAAPRMPHNRQ